MNSIVSADLVKYNANTKNANVGDCVKRALSVGYGTDYDEVGRQLNQIKRDLRYSQWNIDPVIKAFTKSRGDNWYSASEYIIHTETGEILKDASAEGITVDEFADTCSSGVYLLLAGKTKGTSTHMIAIIDGKIYDSWDSRHYIVDEYCKLSNTSTETYELNWRDIWPEFIQYIDNYIAKLSSKCPDYMSIYYDPNPHNLNEYTFWFRVVCDIGYLPFKTFRWWEYRANSKVAHSITVKLNLRKSPEDNLQIIEKKVAQSIYDWSYNIKRYLLDSEKLSKTELNPHFRGDEATLVKLPDWCIPYVTYIGVESESYAYNHGLSRYSLDMEPLPDDPYASSRGEVSFYADTLTELKHNLELYRKKHLRIDYDY